MISEHQKVLVANCPECNEPVYYDEDTGKYVFTCHCGCDVRDFMEVEDEG